jgi:hypothetical protein
MLSPLSPDSELSNFGMRNIPSPSLEGKSDFGMHSTPFPSLERKHAFGMSDTPSPSPEPKQSDFRMQDSLLPEPQDNLGTRPTLLPEPQGFGIHQPTGAEEPLSSSLKTRSEFHITKTFTHLILIHAAWKWGDLALSLGSSKDSQPSTGEHMHESVCCIVYMLV